jgi:hypothetical protein
MEKPKKKKKKKKSFKQVLSKLVILTFSYMIIFMIATNRFGVGSTCNFVI